MNDNIPALRSYQRGPNNLAINRLGLREVLGIFIRRIWIILSIVLPIFLLALFATINATESVTARTRVVVEGKQPEDPIFATPRIDYNVLMSSASQIATSAPVAEKAANALWDSLPVLIKNFPEFEQIQSVQDLRDVILGSASANQVGETNILEIKVSHPSPVFAYYAVGAVTDAYIKYSVERRQNKPAVQYYNEQIEIVKSGLDSLMAEKAKILEKYGLLAFSDNTRASAFSLINLEGLYFKAKHDREGKETLLRSLKETVARDPLFLPRDQKGNTELLSLKQMLNTEENNLKKLEQKFTPNSEWVVRQRAVVDELRSKFLKARDDYIKGLEIELEVAREVEAGAYDSFQKQKNHTSDFPIAQQKIESIDIEKNTQLDFLELLQTKRGEVRLKAGTDSRISSILLLNSPSLDNFLGGGKKFIYLALSGLFGLALGILAALLVENQDHRVFDKAQLQEYLELPVLGSISKVEK